MEENAESLMDVSDFNGTGNETFMADWSQDRVLCAECFSPYPKGSGREYLRVSEMGFLMVGDEQIDVRGLHNIVSGHQPSRKIL